MKPHPLALFSHCPRCGAPGFAEHDFKSKRCPACGFVLYHNAAAAVVAVVTDASGRLLVVRRRLAPAAGTLDLPGGFVDAGETLEAACLRELHEETGARGRIERYLFSLPNIYPYSGYQVDTTDSFFLCRVDEGADWAASDDAAELLWLSPEEIRPDAFGLASIRTGIRQLLNKKHLMEKVTFQGTPVTLQGTLPAVGTKAPKFGGVKGDLSVLHLPDLLGRRVVLNIFPSLDTPVCAASVRRFNQAAASLENTTVLCVSKDLPFAQARFCTTEGIANVTAVSTFRCHCFDEKYGLVMTDGPLKGLLARAVIVIDEAGTIIYEELVPEITHEPDYEAALAALK